MRVWLLMKTICAFAKREKMVTPEKMHIAYLAASNTLSGGLRVICQQAEELAKRGHSVSVVCPEPQPDWSVLHAARWEASPFQFSKALQTADIRVATFWSTVSFAVHNYKGAVFHLCQGYEADFSFYRPIKRKIEAAYAKPTHKLSVSPHIAERLQTLGYAPVTYIGQTFDRSEFSAPEKRCLGRAAPTILLVGIFEADVKGIREALLALDRIRRSGATFRLTRVSPNPPSPEEEALFMADNYFAHITTEQMSRIYQQADLFIGPSHPEEGFGLPALEALSSGLPAVLSDTPGHRYIARSAAEYFQCSNIFSLAERVSCLLTDVDRQRTLSALGLIEAGRFQTSDVVDRLLSVFTKAL